jgi:hypothetical protein
MNSPLWIFVLLSAMAAPLLAAPPPNDDFASAQVIPPAIPVSLSGTLVEATAQAGEANYDTEFETLSPLATVWYTWTPAKKGV